eukprot:6190606-Pleurochrysis_carterae.AAC.1
MGAHRLGRRPSRCHSRRTDARMKTQMCKRWRAGAGVQALACRRLRPDVWACRRGGRQVQSCKNKTGRRTGADLRGTEVQSGCAGWCACVEVRKCRSRSAGMKTQECSGGCNEGCASRSAGASVHAYVRRCRRERAGEGVQEYAGVQLHMRTGL